MLRNYLVVALRALRKQKAYAAINVFGLAIGLAFCLLIFLFVRDELTYDRFHEGVDRLFRVELVRYMQAGEVAASAVNDGFILAPTLQAEIPEVAHATRFHIQPHYLRGTDMAGEATEEDVAFTDAGFFRVFTFPLLRGDAATALSDLQGVVLTASTAQKHFGQRDPMGQPVQLLIKGTYRDLIVTGIAADPPRNSSVRFDAAVRYEQLVAQDPFLQQVQDSWRFSFVHTYVRLQEETSPEAVQAKLPAFTARYRGEQVAQLRQEEGWAPDGVPLTYVLRPITEVHFRGESRPLFSYLLAGLALTILVMACINFTTLAIGRSAWRTKEVGVRKVVGAQRSQLVGQFWSEALLMSALAALLGLGVARLCLPLFNAFTDKALTLGAAGPLVLALAGLALGAGLLAGSYPAFVLSAFRPVEAFRGRFRLGGANPLTRTLVVVQFALTAFLLVGALVLGRQIRYLTQKDLGFDHARVVSLPAGEVDGARVAARLRDRLRGDPRIEAVTASGTTLGYRGTHGFSFEEEGQTYRVNLFPVETNHLDFFGLTLVAGRNFEPGRSADTTEAIVVNETLVRQFGLDDPLGKSIPGLERFDIMGRIVGVVRDYHFQALYQEVEPVMLTLQPHWGFDHVFVRLEPGEVSEGLRTLKAAWAEAVPGVPFTYRFLDDEMDEVYALERRWSQIARYASFFAALIACMGLLGLTALTVAGRTKEIGIRKVLGASARHILLLIARDFGLLVGIGFILAAAPAFLLLRWFLSQYAFHVGLGPGAFLMAALLLGLLAFGTVGTLVLRAARRDPVESLRYE